MNIREYGFGDPNPGGNAFRRQFPYMARTAYVTFDQSSGSENGTSVILDSVLAGRLHAIEKRSCRYIARR